MIPRQFPIQPTVSTVGAAAIVTLLIFGSDLMMPSSFGDGPETINWRSQYDSAYFEAKSGKRLLWVQFTGPWCPNCRRMERDSFVQAKIVERARVSFVPVKLRSDENEDLAMRFSLTGLPATVLIDPETQQIVSLHQGYLGPDELDTIFGEAVAARDVAKKASSQTQLASGTNTNDDRPNLALLLTNTWLHRQGIPAELKNTKLPAHLVASAVSAGAKLRESSLNTISKHSRLAMSGYCPVSLVTTHKLVRGEPSYAVYHEGNEYRFASESMSQQFLAEPSRFIPINDGRSPVAGVDQHKNVDGDPRYGILYRDRLYLCSSSAERKAFLMNPEKYALAHIEEKGYCPHCSRKDGLLVRGNPRFGLIKSGREYWFPDAEHRSAFLSSLANAQKTVRK